jgi:nitroimidazol reductase NimA-like FMN-containing flavoprotein (pyridoxamine 5'-phosphate oxidase superfamily)
MNRGGDIVPSEMNASQIEGFLASEAIGRLGVIDEGRPYVVPLSYAYRDSIVYCHSAQGRKIRAMRNNPDVCFEIDRVESLSDWTSVIAYGTFEQLLGPDAIDALDALRDRFQPSRAGNEYIDPGAEMGVVRVPEIPRINADALDLGRPGNAALVYRIRLHTKTGRMERP